MSPEAIAVIEQATAVAFLSEAGLDHQAQRRVPVLFDAVIAYQIAERGTVCAAAGAIAASAGRPGSIGLATECIRRRCRHHNP